MVNIFNITYLVPGLLEGFDLGDVGKVCRLLSLNLYSDRRLKLSPAPAKCGLVDPFEQALGEILFGKEFVLNSVIYVIEEF